MRTIEQKKDKVLFELCGIIAKRIEENPMPYIRKAISRNRKSKRVHGSVSFTQEWDKVLHSSWQEIKHVLIDKTDRSRWLRQSCPFHGIITDDERMLCLLRHAGRRPSELQAFKRRCHVE